MFDLIEPSHSGRSAAAPARRSPAAPAPRSDRRASSPSRAPPPLPRRPADSPALASACADHPLLRRAVRRGQTVARAVLVDRAAPHHRQHPVPVAPRIGQPLHQQHAGALAPAGAVGGAGERLAAPVGGQRRAGGRTRRTRPGSPSPSRRRPAPARTRPAAAPGTPGAAPPATTSTPCRRSPPDPAARRCRRCGPTTRWRRCR